MTPEERIELLERRLQEAEERIQRMVDEFNRHTHRHLVDYGQTASCGCCSGADTYGDTDPPDVQA